MDIRKFFGGPPSSTQKVSKPAVVPSASGNGEHKASSNSNTKSVSLEGNKRKQTEKDSNDNDEQDSKYFAENTKQNRKQNSNGPSEKLTASTSPSKSRAKKTDSGVSDTAKSVKSSKSKSAKADDGSDSFATADTGYVKKLVDNHVDDLQKKSNSTKNGKSKAKKQPVVIESTDEDVTPQKIKGKRKKQVILSESESDTEDPMPDTYRKSKARKSSESIVINSDSESPIKATKGTKRGRKRKSSESCEELSSPPKAKAAIVEAFAHQSAKQPKKKEVTTKPVAAAPPAPQLKPVDAKDFFGSQSAWKQDRGRSDAKPMPAAAADHGAKQQNVTPKKVNRASEIAEQSHDIHAGIGNVKKSPLKASAYSQKMAEVEEEHSHGHDSDGVHHSPTDVHTTPVNKKTSTSAASDASTPTNKKTPASAASYRSFLNREGPKSLGSKEVPQGGENCLEGLTFVLTGVLESFDRDEMKHIVERFGGRVTGSVSKKTSYVVVGRDAGATKVDKAAELNVKQLDEDGLLTLIATLPAKKSKYTIAAEQEAQKEAAAAAGKQKAEKAAGKKEAAAAVTSSLPAGRREAEKTSSYFNSSNSNNNNSSQGKANSQQSPVLFSSPAVGANNSLAVSSQSQSSQPASTPQPLAGSDAQLWVDKYKPQSLKQLIGQQGDKSNANKLVRWLREWHHNISSGKKPAFNKFSDDGSGYRAALLSGPPGVGKTSTAQLVCKELGFSFVELNASDTRSKKSLEQDVAETLRSHTLVDFLGGSSKSGAGNSGDVGAKHCLVMDEVDGMAGNEDRGGMQELIGLIKSTRIPIICMCNDRNHPKVRSLSNYCFDLRFQRPRAEQIKAAMMSLAFKEGVKIPPPALNDIIEASDHDIRQIIHNLSMWSATEKVLSQDQLKQDSNKARKDLRLGPFDVCRKVLCPGEERLSVIDKSDLFFQDYSFIPLFVQENYAHVTPHAARGSNKRNLQLLAQAADSISIGDTVERCVRGGQQWNLLPVQAIFSTVVPGEAMKGSMGGMIKFPSWLGKNSTTNKNERLLAELRNHMRLQISADKGTLNREYIPHLQKFLVKPLIDEGAEGVPRTMAFMEQYCLLREDLDSLLELRQGLAKDDLWAKVDSKVKAAFTRAYNKESHVLPYAQVAAAKKGRGRGGGEDMLPEDLDEDAAAAGDAGDEEKEEEEDISKDAMVKAKVQNKGKGKRKADDADPGEGTSKAAKATKGTAKGKGGGKKK